jgi:polyisoprenyl-teichoic acid--peptidoglycan teichoic acid transferase
MLARAKGASHRREGHPAGLTQAMSAAALSAVLPGLGQLFAGRRLRALPYLLFSATSLGIGAAALSVGRVRLLELLVQPAWLTALTVASGISLIVRAISAVDGYGCMRPIFASPRGRSVAGLLLLGILVLGLAVPHVIVARDVAAQQNLLSTVFQDQVQDPVAPGPVPSDTPLPSATSTPTSSSPSPSPAKNLGKVSATLGRDGRFTVLLLGSDAGPSRSGARTDTMILLSINPKTRSALMIGIPRNLRHIPFPPGPMQQRFPEGFNDLANAVYGYGTNNPSLFPHAKDPGARAIEEAVAAATGLEVDDWAMVDLDGVVGVVKALGGLEIDIPEHLADRVSPYVENGPWISADIEPGRQHLTADQVYVYVRSRHADSDYQRMRRQRCVLEAMGDQLTGPELVTEFPGLAGAVARYVSTDIPKSRLPALVHLGATLSTSRVRTLLLTPPLVQPPTADYAAIRALVRDALAGRLPSTNGAANLSATCSS